MAKEDNVKPYRVTSIDVAERAGVSQSTVSRALSGSETITEATRRRVEQAAEELGYHVNMRAAGLRKGETGTIAIVVIGRDGQGPAAINPFYYSLLGSTCAAAAERGYEALVSFQAKEDELFGHYVGRRQADGVVVIGTATNKPAWDYFREVAKATDAIAFWGSPFDDAVWVRSDNRAGGKIAVERLISGGAKNIVFVGDPNSPQKQFRERFEGYTEAMTASGLPLREPEVAAFAEGEDRVTQGRAAVAQLCDGAEPIDGVFFACDAMALGALEELSSRDIAVPGKIRVVGFDGLGSGEFSNPPLTTVEPDFAEAGRLLVETALAAGEGERPERRVPVRLVERASA